MALLPPRRKVTGDTLPWGAWRGISGQPFSATTVAGATNVAPSASSKTVRRRHQRERYSMHARHSGCGGRKEAGYAETLLCGWRRRRRLFNAWRDTPSRPAATP
jgi:hypothetical protein